MLAKFADLVKRGASGSRGRRRVTPVVAAAAKICIVQSVYNVFFAVPWRVIACQWKNGGFSATVLRPQFHL